MFTLMVPVDGITVESAPTWFKLSVLTSNLPRMVWTALGRVSIVVHGTEAPTDEEWDRYLADVKKSPRIREIRVLVYSFGAGPTTFQRQKLHRQGAGHSPPVAILANRATQMRTVGTALTWFNGNVAVFEPSRMDDASSHLGLLPPELPPVVNELRTLKARFELQTGAED